jgi:antirestriction protein ArdC
MKQGKAVRCDIQQQVTDRVIEQLEQGGLSPWQCPWTKTGEPPMPYNWLTKQPYNGINILLLWDAASRMGYSTNTWLTFKQAQQLGGCVRKGEKSVRCIFYKTLEVEDRDAETDAQGQDRKVSLPCMREFSLFNIEQVDGLSDLPAEPKQPAYDAIWAEDDDAIWAIDTIAKDYCHNTAVKIRHGGDRAFYSPTLDMIRLPTTFHKGSDYAATLAHELIHSTGHKSRLDRFSDQTGDLSGLEASYAFEELVAELGAAFVCAELRVQGQHEQHASYIDHWLGHLRNDKTFLFKAAAQAGKAYRLLMQGGVPVETPLSSAA